jgi:hypothetical protein
MRLRLAYLLLVLVVAVGCRVTPQQRAVLTQYEHDLRRYEDLIYELEYEYEILCDENEALKMRLEEMEHDSGTKSSRSRTFRSSDTPPTKSKKPVQESHEEPMDDLAAPVIETGPMTPVKPKKVEVPPQDAQRTPEVPRTPHGNPLELERSPAEAESPALQAQPSLQPKLPLPNREKQIHALPPLQSAPEEKSDTLPPPREERKFSQPLELLPAPQDNKVSQLLIDPQQTRGLDVDQAAGDEGVRLVLQPRNEQGEAVPANGKVTVVLVDPQLEGEAARVGRWEFDANEIRYASRRRQLALDLPWQDLKPTHADLALFVRYESAAGERIDTKHLVRVSPPSSTLASNGWTPRSSAGASKHPANNADLNLAEQPARKPENSMNPPVVVATESSGAEVVSPASHAEPVRESKPAVKRALVRPEWKPYR